MSNPIKYATLPREQLIDIIVGGNDDDMKMAAIEALINKEFEKGYDAGYDCGRLDAEND